MTTRQRLTAALLLGASFMLSVDFSILNVALPQVGTALGFGMSSLAWVSTAYALPAAGSPCCSGGSPICTAAAGSS